MSENAGRVTGKRRPHGAGRVFKPAGCTSWYVAYCAPRGGKAVEIRERAGKSEEEALRLLKKRLAEVTVSRGGFRQFQGPRQEKVTSERFLMRW